MSQRTGRPRRADLDAALVEAAGQILLERGFEELSVDGLVKRAGTTRPAFYRRYRNLGDLLVQLLLGQHAIRLEEIFDTGGLESDLVAVQRDQLAFFTEPLVRRSLPGVVASLRADEELRQTFYEGFLFPRRRSTGLILQRGLARGEIRPGFDPEWICDLLTGPFLLRVVFPGTGRLDEELVQATVGAAVSVLNPLLAVRSSQPA